MSVTLCLLTASVFAGQAPGSAYPSSPTPAPLAQPAFPASQPDAPPPAPTLRDRIRNLFSPHREQKDPPPSAPTVVNQAPPSWAQRPAAPAYTPGQPMTTTVTVQRPNLTPVPAGPAGPSDLDKAGHEQDYSWITGRLARDSGNWVIRYAGPNEIDRFGGRLALTGNLEAAKMREGALVCVIGQVVNGRNLRGAATPVYQVRQINMVEPPRP